MAAMAKFSTVDICMICAYVSVYATELFFFFSFIDGFRHIYLICGDNCLITDDINSVDRDTDSALLEYRAVLARHV